MIRRMSTGSPQARTGSPASAIAAIVVKLPFCSSPVALPELFRLWRGKGTPSQVELAAEMVKILAGAFPGRAVHGGQKRNSRKRADALTLRAHEWTHNVRRPMTETKQLQRVRRLFAGYSPQFTRRLLSSSFHTCP